ncbi:hypothetical protein PILCRDRAFT_828350 [Piloderma croceum F 1598]|uniref:Uncharacterized protein n=1 Tax=Piloderma croceum (strain F 1598) TaxID=765440 RepID=A0A0C3EP46_PILCF|nr:hypothetical protein PILCRDRAFT_828350 [Piloderma croceum F 1598]
MMPRPSSSTSPVMTSPGSGWDAEVARPPCSSGRSSLSSLTSQLSTNTHVEDTDAMGGGKEALSEATAGEITLLSKSSTVDGEVSTALNSDDLLKYLLDGAQHAVDVNEVVECAVKSFKMIANRYNARSIFSNSALDAIGRDARVVGNIYVEAIESSVKVVGYGVVFATDVINLCENLAQEPDMDIGQIIKEMREIAQLTNGDVETTYEKFRVIRGKLDQIIRETPARQEQIKDGQDNNKRRTKEQVPTGALEFLGKASDDMGKLVDGVAKFTNWWSETETMISTLENVPVNGRQIAAVQLNMVQKNWEVVREQYEVYRRTIDALADFHPVNNRRTYVPCFKKLKAVFLRKSTRFSRQKCIRGPRIPSWRSLR